MLLALLAVCSLFLGSSGEQHEVCYGKSFPLPSDYTPPLYKGPLILKPSRGGPTRTLMDNGMAIDPRLKLSSASATLTDLTEKDEGTYSVSLTGQQHTIFTLKILDCAENVERYYGDKWNLFLPETAEVLEITPHNILDPPVVLWNRTNHQVKSVRRGQVNGNFWEVQNVTQEEIGFYNIRQKDNTLLSRTYLKVAENVREYKKEENGLLIIEYPWDDGPWSVTFSPVGETVTITLIKDGQMHSEDWFGWRLDNDTAGLRIHPLEMKDSGTFEYRDQKGYLVLVAHLVVERLDDPPAHPLLYVFISVAFVLGGLFCWWFWCRKKCCKKDKSAPQAAAPPPMQYCDESQTVGPSYSPVPSPAAPQEQPVYHHPVSDVVTPSPLQVAPPGGSAASAALNSLSTDTDPQFDLKEVTIPSTPPLSSDSTHGDTYTSEKLNMK